MLVSFVMCAVSFGETMLQYFNTSWEEITARIPELAEAGYTALWLPPPTKGSGGLSVGYDLWDPFDLGGNDQRGSVRTRYGTEAELLNLVETAHRFGIRIYFDNIMNHRAFDIPGYNENTPIDIYPGMVPEDFHLRVTEDGFYRKWDNCRDWNSAWQVMNLGLADLIDIAHETPNDNFGPNEGDDHPKISFVRQPNNPEYYYDTDLPISVGYGEYTWNVYTFADKEPYTDTNGNGRFDWTDTNANGQHDSGEASEPFTDTGLDPTRPGWNTTAYGYGDGKYNMGNPVSEDVGAYLIRAARWLLDRTKADGLRLDAVKHVPAYFFGEYGSDTSDAGYCGGAQVQFNITRGFSDWDNHRDTVFNTEAPRDDAMMFGEHLGEPPGYGDYLGRGMRLVDNPLRNELNNRLGSMWNGLNGYDSPGAGGFSPDTGVMHAQSHDNDYAARRELQHAFYFTRAGLGLLYTDGNHHAETLGESGGAFPRHANTSFLGQWGDVRVPNLLYIHEQFARGYQKGVWSDGDYVAYERLDWRQGGSTDGDKVTMLFMLNDNYADGQARDIRNNISFSHTEMGDNAYLYNYSSYGGGFYTWASDLDSVIVPAGGYFAFSWKNPDPSSMWTCFGGSPVTIYQNGAQAGTLSYTRKDGPDGDANFNPYSLPDTNSTDYAYTMTVPRITSPTNVNFVAHVDGSAANVLLKLDGGMDLNGANHAGGDPRDNPPALSDDIFVGYEQPSFVSRVHREKFAAVNSASNKIGSAGAETYHCTIGSGSMTINPSDGVNDGNNSETAFFVWHSPSATTDQGALHFSPAPAQAAGSNLTIWVKTGDPNNINHVCLYYTTDGATWPEGAGGMGAGNTRTIQFSFDHSDSGDSKDWWKVTVPAMSSNTVFRYKIGGYRQQDGGTYAPWNIVWPADANAVALKTTRMGTWQVTNFSPSKVSHRVHADYGTMRTGLVEGFHMISARAFLERDNRAALYNTFKQTFYYDAMCPTGFIQYPANNGDSVAGQQYGVVVRTDPSVTEVWFNIADWDTNNDDVVTGVANGNGNGFEPYVDGNGDGNYDTGETFTDINGNGVWNSSIGETWVQAYSATPSDMSTVYPKEWRFNYNNIPAGGSNATIRVRLRELSSVARPAFTNHTDTTGHFTTLQRTVYTDGPEVRMFIAWPQQNGDYVGEGYVMKAYFTKALADGLSSNDLIDRFLIKIQSSESGKTDGGVAQSRDTYSIHWNETDQYHALSMPLGNLYNGVTDWLHGIEVTFDRDSLPDLVANRLVRATPAAEAPYIAITEPPEYGPDGRPHQIIIPDVQNPSNEQRRTTVRIETGTNAASVSLSFTYAPDGYPAQGGGVSSLSSTNSGSSILWECLWTNLLAGQYGLLATVSTAGGVSNSALRNATVVKREWVNSNTNDLDDDDDGLNDVNEATSVPLPNARETDPEPNPETWDNGEVHVHFAYGRSLPQSPDSDGDGLPDGLECGWRNPSSSTDTNADTNGDGWKNFCSDYDPPFYNTLDNYGKVPGVNSQSEGGDRAKQLYGSMTDPANPDTDGDGLPDGIEDANRNGWVDGDGEIIDPASPPSLGRSWPNGEMDTGETWTETDPNNSDTDGDGLSDGYGEDRDFNGRIAGDSNSNRIYNAGEAWTETDPLKADTDGDGLPDGWESQYNLDPLDNGTDSLRTASGSDGDAENGASGDPDGDGFDNATELVNGTNPRWADTGVPPPEGTITIGRGPAIGVINGATNYQEFSDWSADDLIALDDYNNGGSQAVDIYRAWDGFDTSRDIVAFYAHDGGSAGSGGDGLFHFRIDLLDLQPMAEDGYLDLYVIIDMNSPGVGEASLPDSADMVTEMKWEAAVAVYGGNNGRVYVDTQRANNSVSALDDLSPYGVVGRDQNTASGFGQAYFNSELDAVEFSISRQALLDAGWNGLNPGQLNYQVFTMKDGTQNSPAGPGDIGGRNDLRDSITDDWVCSDYWRDQGNIQLNGKLYSWVGRNAANDYGKAAKVAMLVHGNQHITPGSEIQNLINDGSGAGYHRALEIHDVCDQPLNLHVTPTLASAIQWARADTNAGKPWLDGPALNERIRSMILTNTVKLLGSTFSDHILPYFTPEFNNDNAELARDHLKTIYSFTNSDSTVFWPPERVLDADVLGKITNMGYRFTLIDQNTHMWNWIGRTPALSDDGYRINKINGVYCFVINNSAGDYRFVNTDGGLSIPLREMLNRRARSDTQDQVATILSNWEDFGNSAQADAYDRNIRWLANHPWIQLVALEDIAAGRIDITGDGGGDYWGHIDRGASTPPKTGHIWVQHATQNNYDNWYVGSAQEEGLQNKVFEIRPGTNLPAAYGMLYYNGIVSSAWEKVKSVSDTSLARLARAAIHASVFETAFHEEDNNDLRRFSTGDFIYPDTTYNSLIGFAKNAQSQTRMAAVYMRVDQWASAAAGLTNTTAALEDVDLDGENECLLYNGRVMFIMERTGGRMIMAFARDSAGSVFPVSGTPMAYSGSETELEGTANAATNGSVEACRTSCLKDWWAGTTNYVNMMYAAVNWTNGWRLTSADGKITKTLTLGPKTNRLEVAYSISETLNGGVLYVRNGLSPDTEGLMLYGQQILSDPAVSGGRLALQSERGAKRVKAVVAYGDAGHTAGYNAAAVDDNPGAGVNFDTVNMRNQAMTHQVELVGTNSFTFALEFDVEDTGANSAPVIVFVPSGPYIVPLGSNAVFSVSVSDADGDPLLTTNVFAPSGLNVAGGTNFSWLATTNWFNTTNAFYFIANDQKGKTNSVVTNTTQIIVAYDWNANGMDDLWEWGNFTNLDAQADGDADGDRFDNYAEYIAGTQPNNPASLLSAAGAKAGANWRIAFGTVTGRTYTVWRAEKPGDTWTWAAEVSGTGSNVVWTDTGVSNLMRRIYRIEVEKD